MALNGAPANLGPESDAWVRELERLVLEQERAIGQLRGLIQGTNSR
ncbi:MAG: hypothetical protein K0S37_746 [Microbacterium sp.]|jgi:hypothetical protein|nr:hypothetical protein [Microbacterium sp.]